MRKHGRHDCVAGAGPCCDGPLHRRSCPTEPRPVLKRHIHFRSTMRFGVERYGRSLAHF